MKTKIASYISIIGHPLLTIPVFSVIVFFTYEAFEKALVHSILILAGFFLPLSIKMYLNSKNGTYTNFDVSNRTQRQSWYIYALLLLLAITIILFATEQPRVLRLSVLFSFLLLLASKITNYFIKSSLHVSFNIFLAFLILPINLFFGLFFLAFTIVIAWSRLTLKRHSLKEIIAGTVLGLIIGMASFYCIW